MACFLWEFVSIINHCVKLISVNLFASERKSRHVIVNVFDRHLKENTVSPHVQPFIWRCSGSFFLPEHTDTHCLLCLNPAHAQLRPASSSYSLPHLPHLPSLVSWKLEL